MEGYIKFYRKIRENSLWLEPRRFSKVEAWIDLLLRANHKERVVLKGYEHVCIKAGELVASQVKLADAWGWHRETVGEFLDLLQSDNQIVYKTSNRFTLITIRNWDKYQSPIQHQNQHRGRLNGDIKSSTINNDNNEKNANTTDDVKRVIKIWNERMPWKIWHLPESRFINIQNRLKEPAFKDNYQSILTKILESDFLLGKKPTSTHKNFRADLDWIVKNDTNYVKILEGRYDATGWRDDV
jgi:hypothetical protein